ncbi:hypothetical protein HY628_01220 [Candidatus Uhrbacteria bacterium]|nr:hypothetical protein [Candidatus Uhrbacteria bacterium]
MYLLLDPRHETEIEVAVWDGQGSPQWSVYHRNHTSLFEFLIHSRQLSLKKLRALTGIFLIPGPGGFSTVRGAAVLTNILGLAAGIPLYPLRPRKRESREAALARVFHAPGKSSHFIPPIYGKPPHLS